ncbi:MAG: VCBS repeat-containing protein [Saprospiraceae bacterium]|nr:VCBS repeat-containing protein [Saprospiraceae bacterium]
MKRIFLFIISLFSVVLFGMEIHHHLMDSVELVADASIDLKAKVGLQKNTTLQSLQVKSKTDEDVVLEIGGARLEIPAGALVEERTISISVLASYNLPPLDQDLVNVTPGGGGFRCLPHGTTFLRDVRFTVPFDSCLIPPGYSAKHIRTFFYNEQAARWESLPYDTLLATQGALASMTTHFTDFINGIIKTPDAPETQAYPPTAIKDLKAAPPSANIDAIAPPTANNMGTANIQLPIKIPAGRKGMQPQLALRYNSEGGNGWAGLGWDLSIPAVTIETRWGVPRYDLNLETETYTLSGEMLTPVAHRTSFAPRTTGGQMQFYPRVEGSFRKIIRHGTSPKDYWWEVTEKDGTRSFYGGDGSAVVEGAVLRDDDDNIAYWGLRETRDLNGNFVRYKYITVDDLGVPNSQNMGRQIYPKEITYTGFGSTEGSFSVKFIRDGEMGGQPQRPDIATSARLGFKQVTTDLLRKIVVEFKGNLVRDYELVYGVGAFNKMLLMIVLEHDQEEQEFYRHSFDYWNNVQDANNEYQPYLAEQLWTSPDDDVKGSMVNPIFSSRVSLINGSRSSNWGLNGAVSFGFGFSQDKNITIGANFGFSKSTSEGLLALIDLNGDGLPDKVFRDQDGKLWYRRNLSRTNKKFGPKIKVQNIEEFSRSRTTTYSVGVQATAYAFIGENLAKSKTVTDVYFSDFNGDGLMDIALYGEVWFNRLNTNGDPDFTTNSSLTPCPIEAGTPLDPAVFAFDPAEQIDLEEDNPLHDVVRLWKPPFPGRIRISAPVRLWENTSDEALNYKQKDGIRVSIEHKGNVIWDTLTIKKDEYDEKAIYLDNIEVDTNDHIYFRLHSIYDGAYDQVLWDPEITYDTIFWPSAPANEPEPNGKMAHVYRASADFVQGLGQAVGFPYKGKIHVGGNFSKPRTTDSLTLVLTKIIEIDDDNVERKILYEKGFKWDEEVNNFILGDTFDVEKDESLLFSIKSATNVDWSQLSFEPRLSYLEAFDTNGMSVPVLNDQGLPYYVFHPDPEYTMYNYIVRKTQAFFPDTSGEISVNTFFFPIQPNDPALLSAPDSATLTISVKGVKTLYAQKTFSIKNHIEFPINADIPIKVQVPAQEPVFIEYHIDSRAWTDNIARQYLKYNVSFNGDDVDLSAGMFTNLSENEFIFGNLHRGWGQFAYRSNGTQGENPIDRNLLKLDDKAKNPPKRSVIKNMENPNDIQNEYDPSSENFVVMMPDALQKRWYGYDDNTWVAPDTISSSRMGDDDVSLVGIYNSGSSTLQAPRLISISEANTFASGVDIGIGDIGLGASYSKSDNTNTTETSNMDLNMDGYPDYIGSNYIQITTPTGGRSDELISHNLGNHVSNSNSSGKAASGSFPVPGNGNSGTPGKGMPRISIGNSVLIQGQTNNAGQATQTAQSTVSLNGNMGSGSDQTEHSWMDINGDGLIDKVFRNGQVRLNYGYRFGDIEQWGFNEIRIGESSDYGAGVGLGWGNSFNVFSMSFSGGVSVSETNILTKEALQDINGDGLVDIIIAQNPLRIRLNNGNGFSDVITWKEADKIEESVSYGEALNASFTVCITFPLPPIKICFTPGFSLGQGVSKGTYQIMDIDGDGYPDLLTSNEDNELKVRSSSIGCTNLLRSVQRPMGSSFSIGYNLVGNTSAMQRSKWALSSVEIFDGLAGDGPTRTASKFEYQNGYYDRRERDFYGFATVISTQLNTANNDAPYRMVTQEYNNQNYYEKGLLMREVMTDADGKHYTETLNTYEVRDIATGNPLANLPTNVTDPGFPALLKTEKRFFEGQPTAGLITEMRWQYDLAGNISHYTEVGDGTSEDLLQAVIEYHNLPSVGVSSIPKSIRVQAGGQQNIRHRETYIDNRANVVQIRQYLDSNTSSNFDMTYDAYGNLSKITRPPNDSSQRLWFAYEYDPEVHTYVVRVSDAYGLSSTAVYDYVYGQLLESTDVNGKQMKYTIDAQGRITTITGPYELASGQPYTIAFDYHPDATVPYARTRHYDPETGQDIETYTFMDGLMRPIQVKKTSAIFAGDGAADNVVYIVSGQTKYDAFGRTVEEGQPATEPISNPTVLNSDPAVRPTRTEYDVLDRPVLVTLPDASQIKSEYGFGLDNSGYKAFLTKTTDPKGTLQETYTDLRERKRATRVFDPNGIWTGYRYNAISELLAVITHNNDSTQYTYDLLGRKIRVKHPDFGENRMTYDLAGNIITESTSNLRTIIADSAVIRYSYRFGRLTRIDYPDNYQNQVEYRYGEPGAEHNRAGRVWLQIDVTGGQEFFYGPLGEIEKTIRTIVINPANQQTYVWEARYDTWNRIQTQIYPDGEIVDYAYNRGGKVNSVTGLKDGIAYNYLTQLGYDEFEQRVFCRLGNGTTTAYTYDPARRWLTGLNTDLPNGRRIMAMAYTYDAVGNVLSLTNSTLPPTGTAQMGGQTAFEYSYDPLYRLISATGNWTGANNKSTSFTLDMAYDNRHNILRKTQAYTENGILIDKSPLTHDNRYTYGAARPHAPDTVGLRRYTYDANGNTTGWSDKDTWRQMLWDEENRLTSVSVEGFVHQYTYDHKGERAIKSSGGSQGVFENGAPMQFINHNSDYTAYVSPEFVVRDHAFTKHYYIEGQRIATKIGAGSFVNRTVLNPFLTAGGLNYIKRTETLRSLGKNHYKQILEPPGTPINQGQNHSPASTGIPHPIYVIPDSTVTAIPPGYSFNPPTPMPEVPSTPLPVVPPTPITSDSVRAGYGYVPPTDSVAENSRYFYHADHLGSSSYITDRVGFVTQHLAYMPFGEAFVDQHQISKDAYRSPYRYTGKEQDEGTDLYYFGARYYDPVASLWLSVDPMTEKYPGWSGYNYVLWNPVKLVDPDGEEPTVEEAAYLQKYQYDGKGKLIGGWKPVANLDKTLFTNEATGFNSGLFERTGNNGKTEFALVFSGTEDGDVKDWKENALQLQGASFQYMQAQFVGEIVSGQKAGNELTMVGHSLGGGLAATASMTTGRKAITFNPETVSKMTESNLGISGKKGNINAYVYNNEILNKVHPNPQGKVFSVTSNNPTVRPRNSLDAHGIQPFINAIENGGLIINRKK